MSDTHELYRAIGNIETNVTILVQSVKELREYQMNMNGKVNKAHDRIDEIAPHVEDYKATKRRAIGIGVSLAGVTGLIGGKTVQFWEYLVK